MVVNDEKKNEWENDPQSILLLYAYPGGGYFYLSSLLVFTQFFENI